MNHPLVLAVVALGLSAGAAAAVEPADLLALAKTAPQPPWPAGDERGMANTLGVATSQRCAWHMAQPQAKWFEVSQVRSNTMPKTPFGGAGGKRSGWGRVGIPYAIREMSDIRCASIHLPTR